MAGRRRARPSRAPAARGTSLLRWANSKLAATYHSAPLGNKSNPLDELIFIQLSVRTRETAYGSTYLALRRLAGGSWARLLKLQPGRVHRVISGGGMGRLKLARILKSLAVLRNRFGRPTLAPLGAMDNQKAEAILRSLPGVGPKVARCVLMYSLDRDVFPVDSNCRRVLTRLGVVPRTLGIKQSHDYLRDRIPPAIRKSLHINLVHHGRQVCTERNPSCPDCALAARCPSRRAS